MDHNFLDNFTELQWKYRNNDNIETQVMRKYLYVLVWVINVKCVGYPAYVTQVAAYLTPPFVTTSVML